VKPASPYLTTDEAAAYLRFPTVNAFHQWRHRHAGRLPVHRRGGKPLFRQSDLDAAVAPVSVSRPLRKVSGL
jgi:hypothetical protein